MSARRAASGSPCIGCEVRPGAVSTIPRLSSSFTDEQVVNTGRLWLIPLPDSLPALEKHFRRYPDDCAPPTAQELRAAADLAHCFIAVSEQLVEYILALEGKPRTR